MNNIVVKNAMIICVGHKDWDFPKSILMESDGKPEERLDDIAKRIFNKYKESQNDEDIYLVTYNYCGDIEMFKTVIKSRSIVENKITRADKIRSMTDEELAKDRVSWENDAIDGEIIPGRYSFITSYGARYSTRKKAEENELKYLQTEI